MRRMNTIQEVYTPSVLPSNTDLDTITKPGIYKVSKYSINGVQYDGTLEVLGWDNHYFRQLFYTIDNKDPNPIFTRVRVNLTQPWKAWEEITQGDSPLIIDLKNTNIGEGDFSELNKYFDILKNNKRPVIFSNFKMFKTVYSSVGVNVYKSNDRYLNIDFFQVPVLGTLVVYSVFGDYISGSLFDSTIRFELKATPTMATLELKPDDYENDGTIKQAETPQEATAPTLEATEAKLTKLK